MISMAPSAVPYRHLEDTFSHVSFKFSTYCTWVDCVSSLQFPAWQDSPADQIVQVLSCANGDGSVDKAGNTALSTGTAALSDGTFQFLGILEHEDDPWMEAPGGLDKLIPDAIL